MFDEFPKLFVVHLHGVQIINRKPSHITLPNYMFIPNFLMFQAQEINNNLLPPPFQLNMVAQQVPTGDMRHLPTLPTLKRETISQLANFAFVVNLFIFRYHYSYFLN